MVGWLGLKGLRWTRCNGSDFEYPIGDIIVWVLPTNDIKFLTEHRDGTFNNQEYGPLGILSWKFASLTDMWS